MPASPRKSERSRSRATSPRADPKRTRTAAARKSKAGPTETVAIPEALVRAATTADIVEVPERWALAIDGSGSPQSADFGTALGALYGLVYTLKFARKNAGRTSFKVPPLEGRWWAEGWTDEHAQPPPELWRWRLRMAVPADVTPTELQATIAAATTRKGGKLEGSADAGRVFLEHIATQRYGRILHVGPYADEPRSFAAIASALDAAGLAPSHAHVEVYLGDPRRTPAAKLRTVLLRELAAGAAAKRPRRPRA